jgi:hypothetical protein
MKNRPNINIDDFDERGCLKDGKTYRAGPVTMMDSGPARVTDGFGRGGLALHRPGYRVLDDEIGARAKEQAYRGYDRQLCDSYKQDAPPASAYPYTAAAEGASCTIDGKPGRLVREGNFLICTPTKQDARSKDPDADKDEEDNDPPRRRRRWTERDPAGRERGSLTEEDSRGVAQRMRDHQANMERIYQDRDYQLTQAWRNPR